MKRAPRALAILAISAAAQAEPSMPPDNSGGRSLHIKTSALLGLGASFLLTEQRHLDLGFCGVTCQRFAVAFTPGLLKEVQDYRKGQEGYRHGLFSRKDLQANALGVAVGMLSYSLAEGLLVKPGKTIQVSYITTF